MPSQPNPDSPYPESQVQRMIGARMPGSPSTAGKGGGVHPGRVSFPAPPTPQAGASGRPPTSTGPVPGGGSPPPTSSAPALPQPSPGTGSSDAQKQAMQQPQQTQPNMGGVQTGQPVFQEPKIPKMGEVAPGAPVQTPQGTVSADAQSGEQTLALNEQGKQDYRVAKAKLRKKLGGDAMPPLLRMSGMPELPVEVGRWNYNPFTGRMEKG